MRYLSNTFSIFLFSPHPLYFSSIHRPLLLRLLPLDFWDLAELWNISKRHSIPTACRMAWVIWNVYYNLIWLMKLYLTSTDPGAFISSNGQQWRQNVWRKERLLQVKRGHSVVIICCWLLCAFSVKYQIWLYSKCKICKKKNVSIDFTRHTNK